MKEPVMDMCIGASDVLWVATDGAGVMVFDIKSGTWNQFKHEVRKGGLSSSAIYSVYRDKDLRMWVGTLRGGINILDSRKNRFTTIAADPAAANSLISNFIMAFCEDPSGNLWIGSDGEGLSFWDRKRNRFANYVHEPDDKNSLSNNNVSAIIRDYQGQVWISTYGGGINRLGKSGTFIRYSCYNSAYRYEDRNVWTLFEDSQHNLWAGTCSDGGLYRYNRRNDKFEIFDTRLKNVLTLMEDNRGELWAGNYTSLIHVDRKSKKHIVYKIGSSVRAIHEDRKGKLWLATEGRGLLDFDRKTGRIRQYTEKDGLPGNSLLNILEDREGNLWISTFNGLCKFNPSTKTTKVFYESDGLQSNQFNYNAAIKLRTGEFLFGGIKGFNIFRPEKVEPLASSSSVQITGLRINNTPFERESPKSVGENLYSLQELTLPYEKGAVSVDFTTVEFTAPDKIQYAYFLEGWDKDWNYAGGSRTANYSRLTEGKYRLRIKSTDAEGAWIDKERVVVITILPPWWRSWWAFLLYLSIFAAAALAWLRHQRKQEQLKYEIKLATLKVEQERELNEKKLSFFTHVAHEFRTPLTLIINPVKEMLYSKDRIVGADDLSVVYRNSKRLLSLVDQLLLFRKAGSDQDRLKIVRLDFPNLCKEVFHCFSQQAQSRNITYTLTGADEKLELYVDREKMEIVLFNLLSNAIKYTQDGGQVSVAIKQDEGRAYVSVSDSGCGIPSEEGDALFNRFYRVRGGSKNAGFGIGLYLVKKFVEAHQGQVSYQSAKLKGTTFLLELKKGRGHFQSSLIFEEVDEGSAFLEELVEGVEEASKQEVSGSHEVAGDIVTDQPAMVVVDDNPQIAEYMTAIFKEEYRVQAFSTAEEALPVIRKIQPDIVISDVVMPGMTGVELCMNIKDDPSLSHIPVILLTASSSDEVKLKGIEGGADDYITKPFDKELLMARVSGIIKSRTNLQRYFFNEVTLRSNDYQISAEYSLFLTKCIGIIEAQLGNPDFSIKSFAAELGMSHSNLYKRVKSISGRSVNEFIRFIRLRKAAEIMINTDCNVNEAAYRAGFNDIKYFREQFSKLFGMKPSEYIRKYRKTLNQTYKLNASLSRT
ncbi:two-component regulator propeller domain-containing protein [Arcticibacter sp. MXS-1]|uniref:two-component regulator propeller domain-containing protein n=1 Tax=Arcticibacter sp. MXS-1 TaxID=3341726 RepID=UPI0035A97556